MSVAVPTFGGVQFRASAVPPSSPNRWWTLVEAVLPGPIMSRADSIEFAGVHGSRDLQLGTGSQRVMWSATVWFIGAGDLVAFENELRDATNSKSYAMTCHGTRYGQAVLKSWQQIGAALPGSGAFWLGKRYLFEFEVLNPLDATAA